MIVNRKQCFPIILGKHCSLLNKLGLLYLLTYIEYYRQLYLFHRLRPDILPVLCPKIGKHEEHSAGKADRIAGHDIGSVDEEGDDVGNRDPDGPQHQQVGKGGVPDFAQAIDETEDSVKHGIGPGERKHNADVEGSQLQNLRFFCKAAENWTAVEGDDQSGDAGDQTGSKRNPQCACFQAGIVSCSQILAGEGGCGGGKRGNGNIGNSCHLSGNGTCGHESGALGIDQRLKHNVSHGINRIVQTKGQANPDNLHQNPFVQCARKEMEIQFRVLSADVENAEYPGRKDCDDRCQSRAGNTHVENGDEQKIKNNVYQAGNHQEKEGRSAVAKTAENAGVHVIAHVSKGTKEDDPQIGNGVIPGISRTLHQLQHKRTDKNSDDGKRDRAQVKKRRCGGNQFLCPRHIAASGTLRDQDGNAGAKPHENAQQHFNRLTACANGSQRGRITVITDDQRIHRVVEHLQDVSGADRKRKEKYQLDHGTFCHVNFLCGFHRTNSPFETRRRFF